MFYLNMLHVYIINELMSRINLNSFIFSSTINICQGYGNEVIQMSLERGCTKLIGN